MRYSFSFNKLVPIEGGCFFGYTWCLFYTSRCVQEKVGRKKRKAVGFRAKVVSFLLKVGKGWPRSVPPSGKSEPRCARRGELAANKSAVRRIAVDSPDGFLSVSEEESDAGSRARVSVRFFSLRFSFRPAHSARA